MSYAPTDPRRALASAGPVAGANVAPQPFEFASLEPDERSAVGSAAWWVRSQAVVHHHVHAVAGDTLVRTGQADEYVVLLADPGARATVRARGEALDITGPALTIVPPGDSEIALHTDATVVRLFAAATAPELCRRCRNDAFYETPDPNVGAFSPWPDPPEGFRIRSYAMDDVPRDPARLGRLFRCTTFMVNWFYPDPGPRDVARLSPHHHDDFEQLSLQLGGDYVHHIRTPWTTDLRAWRDDDHFAMHSPAVVVIPPPAIHTSQGVGDEVHQLIDIFCPPRRDFSERPGWVLNAADYPMPEG